MFLHIGGDDSVAFDEILSMHDYERCVKSAVNRKFLNNREKETVNLAGKEPKTIIFTKERIYISSISVMTLKSRMESNM